MRKYDFIMEKTFGSRYLEYRSAFNDLLRHKKFKFPLHIDIDLRDACNLECVACHSRNRKRSKLLLDKKSLLQIVDECRENNLCSVNFGGCSEPLLDKNYLIEAVKLFKNSGVMDIFIHTNAILLDRNTSKQLIDAGVTFICVSIDAASYETYEKMRGKGFDLVVKNIQDFIDVRKENNSRLPFLRVSFLLTKINYHERKQFMDYWHNRADIAEIQSYSFVEGGPEIVQNQNNIVSDNLKDNTITHQLSKRMAIVAPDILARDCDENSVMESQRNNLLYTANFSIKQFWDKINNNLEQN